MIETIRFNSISKIHKKRIRSTVIIGIQKDTDLNRTVREFVNATINSRFLLTVPGESGTIVLKGKVREGRSKRTIEVEMISFQTDEEK